MDKQAYISMATDFYSSEAVMHNIPVERIENTFDFMLETDLYGELYIFEEDERAVGYLLTAITYSQEAGGKVLWLEELYVTPEMRGRGMGHRVFEFVNSELAGKYARLRLEVEPENPRAAALYKSLGYEDIPYYSMIRELGAI